jgi:hypothetical protein
MCEEEILYSTLFLKSSLQMLSHRSQGVNRMLAILVLAIICTRKAMAAREACTTVRTPSRSSVAANVRVDLSIKGPVR